MPYYTNLTDLPIGVKGNLPLQAQEIYRKAFNSAWMQYDQPWERLGDATREETSHRVAWAAVKREYEKDERTGYWRPISQTAGPAKIASTPARTSAPAMAAKRPASRPAARKAPAKTAKKPAARAAKPAAKKPVKRAASKTSASKTGAKKKVAKPVKRTTSTKAKTATKPAKKASKRPTTRRPSTGSRKSGK